MQCFSLQKRDLVPLSAVIVYDDVGSGAATPSACGTRNAALTHRTVRGLPRLASRSPLRSTARVSFLLVA